MKPNPEYDLLFLLRIIEAAEKIRLYSAPFDDAESFFHSSDQKEFNACIYLLGQIGEQAKRLSNSTLKIGSDIDWGKLYGFRNRVVHDYVGIDKHITFEIIKEAIPETIDKISLLISTCLRKNHFNAQDIQIARSSPYLRHVDFNNLK